MLEAQGQRRANTNQGCMKHLGMTRASPVLYLSQSIDTRSSLTTILPKPSCPRRLNPPYRSISRDPGYGSDFTALQPHSSPAPAPAPATTPTHHVSATIPPLAVIGDPTECGDYFSSFVCEVQPQSCLPLHNQTRHYVQLNAVPNPNQQQQRNQPDTAIKLLNNLLSFILFDSSIPRRSTNPQPHNDR